MAEACPHENFSAKVGVARLTDDAGRVTSFMAEIRIHCAACQRQFQFLGLEPGLDLHGARTSIDGLEANIAICPQGEVPSALDRIAVNFAIPRERTN
jgi:hypothetical protein